MDTKTPDPDLARKILIDAGADPKRLRVEKFALGWLVAAPGFGSGVSSDKDEAFDTPQEVAAHLVARGEHKIFAPETLRGEDEPESLGAELLAAEGEGGQFEEDASAAIDPRPADVSEGDGLAFADDDAGIVSGDDGADGGGVIDADFGELEAPATDGSFLIENQPDDIEVEEPEAPLTGQDRFIGLDDLDRRRSLRIGDVVRIGASKINLDELAQVNAIVMRETVDGVYGGPQDVYERFMALSAIQSSQAEKVAFLLAATREEVEAFDPEIGWPD